MQLYTNYSMTRNLNKLKLITLILILPLICFFCVGCSQVDFVTYHNDDGTISEYVYINVDSTELIKYGYNPLKTMADIKDDSNALLSTILNDYNAKLLDELRQKSITAQDYSYYSNGISRLERDWDNGQYIIGLQFQDSKVYKKYYQVLNGQDQAIDTIEETKKTFYTKTYYYGTVGYDDYNLYNTIHQYYINYFKNIPQSENSLLYSYQVSSSRFHSNADYVQQDRNGNYIHTWRVNPDETNKEIYFYTIKANRSIWIIVCISISLTLTIILVIISMLKVKANKNKPLVDSNNEDIDIIE